jgi:hypothetical protein
MLGGIVHRADDANSTYSSRHVILKVVDPNNPNVTMYLVYFHLDRIASGIAKNAPVKQGDRLGTVGEDGASYPHLHIEFRRGSNSEMNSVHPLGYLPYNDSPNFTPPVVAHFNRLNGLMAARLLFTANSKLEGDLQRVEVDVKGGGKILQPRAVDFNDKNTVNEGNADDLLYTPTGDIGVEGYQKSNMPEYNIKDLSYGVLVRNLPVDCDALDVRIFDVSHNVVTKSQISVPNQAATNIVVLFENGLPSDWSVVASPGVIVTVDTGPAAHAGSWGMVCSSTAAGLSAAIETALPNGRFEWHLEGWFKLKSSSLVAGDYAYLLHFLNADKLGVAARIRHNGTTLVAGLASQTSAGTKGTDSSVAIGLGGWHKWRLSLLRLATRQATAVLYLDDDEKVRQNWDSTGFFEPFAVRAGIARCSAAVAVMADDLRVTESI